MTGYTRQSAANMTTGAVIYASDLNNELNALQSAFDGSTGHAHDGSTGNGPKINLTTSVTGILPAANGGIGGLNKLDATTAPGVTDDANDGYVVGSFWVDITNDIIYFALDVTPGAAVWSRYQPYDIELTALAGLTSAADKLPYFTGSGTAALTTFTSYGRSLVDDADAPAARSTLGLGTISTQAANSVNITGGSISGITDLAVADGGTGASDSSGARTNLGLVIGTDVQAYNAALSSIAGLSTSSNQMIYTTGSNAYATTALTSFARSILDDSDAASARSTLGLVIGTDVQAYDTELAAIAGLTSAADRLPYFTGSGTAALATFTSAGRALVDDVDAQAQRTTLAAAGLADDNTFSGINTFTKTQVWSKGADVASASTLTLGDDGNYFDVTGTTTITSIATVGVGTVVKLHFDAALTLTHHSTDLVLPGGANITTAAGDEAEFVEYATGDWRCTNYIRAAGLGNRLSVQNSGIITLSGTSTEMTGIPAGVQKLILSVDGVSISSGSALYIQLGSSSGYATSGYAGVEGRINGSIVGTGATASLGWLVSSANGVNGVGIYTLIKQSNGDWVIEGGATYGASSLHVFRGALTGVSLDVDRLKLISGGAGTLSGKVSLMWEL